MCTQVHGPDERLIYSVDRETEGRFSFVAHQSGVRSRAFSCFNSALATFLCVMVGGADTKYRCIGFASQTPCRRPRRKPFRFLLSSERARRQTKLPNQVARQSLHIQYLKWMASTVVNAATLYRPCRSLFWLQSSLLFMPVPFWSKPVLWSLQSRDGCTLLWGQSTSTLSKSPSTRSWRAYRTSRSRAPPPCAHER